MALRLLTLSRIFRQIGVRSMSAGEFGEGSGRGGGTGGSIRDAGGAFGKMEAAREEQYFRKLQQEQIRQLRESIRDHEMEIQESKQAEQIEKLREMKHHLDEEVKHHESIIKQHQEAIERHKQKLRHLEKEQSDSD